MHPLPRLEAEPRSGDHAVELPTQNLLTEPRCGLHSIEIEPGGHAQFLEEVDQVFGGHVARIAAAIFDLRRMPSTAAKGTIHMRAARLPRADAVRQARAPRIVE